MSLAPADLPPAAPAEKSPALQININGADLLALLADPGSALSIFAAKLTGANPADNGNSSTQQARVLPDAKVHAHFNVFQRLREFLSDPYGRLSTFDPVQSAVYGYVNDSMANAQDYPIAVPQGARQVQLWINATSPTDGIGGYLSFGIGWQSANNPFGLAYDASQTTNSGYVGLPLFNNQLYTFDLSTQAGAVHIATATNAAKAVVGFLR